MYPFISYSKLGMIWLTLSLRANCIFQLYTKSLIGCGGKVAAASRALECGGKHCRRLGLLVLLGYAKSTESKK
ncbi:MAG: hypothetical protein P8O16_14605 [Algoriphagus sp.]|uniref:hypothetical protein n=1 Tax=Algoriphagus sp. TaxID=1872435 RepID=UPI00262F347A|nr:hypothetical protein [Algoriphagus sp.]MDG1278511.1 hypothetical protein [Algoriphagus sp.]